MRATLTRRRGFPHRRRFATAFVGGQSLPVTFPSTPLDTRVYIALGADLTADWLSWNWLDITDRVRHDLGIAVTVGRGDERGQVTPSRCAIKVDNNDGHLSRRNPLSPHYDLLTLNTPIWIQLDPGSGFVDQFHGYVNEWPNTWADASGTDAFTIIQCSGVMRRLAQEKVLRSPIYRSIAGRTQAAVQPIAYWPMEDGSGSTQFASAIPGQPAVAPAGSVSFASDSDLAGSDPLPTFSTGASCTFQVPEHDITNAWMVQLVFNIPSDPLVDTVIARIDTGNEGAIQRYDIVVSPSPPPSLLTVQGYDPFGVLQTSVSLFLDGSSPVNPLPADFYGNPWSVRVVEKLNEVFGGTILYLFLSGADGSDVAQVAAGALSNPCTVRSVTPLAHPATNGITFGHVAIHADVALLPAGSVTADAVASVGSLSGWNGEQAHERIRRLCREEGLQVQALAANSAAMGPQGSEKLLAELRACEAADQGFLYEWQFGIGYQALSERYDQPVRFELDFDADHIAGVPQPADDDQRMVNKFTSSRQGGSSATAEQLTGPFRTGPGGPGIVAGSATVNVETDSQLQPHAGWKVRLGTVDEDRWPQLGFHLHGAPDLIPGWLSTPLGHRITVANPPNPMNPYTIDAVIEGFSYRWDEVSWTAVLNTSPASSYMVGAAGDATTPGSWLQTGADTRLVAELASGATSALVDVDGPLFSTDSADLTASPLSVVIGGEVMPVSAIASALTETFTRSVAPWGTANSGQTWACNPSSQFLTSGTQALIGVNAVDTVFSASIADIGGNFDATVHFYPNAVSAGDFFDQRMRWRDSGGQYVESVVRYQTTGQIDLLMQSTSAVLSTLSSHMAYGSSTVVGARVQVSGSTARHKIWDASGSEPEAWAATVNVLVPGAPTDALTLVAFRATANSQSGLAVSFDDIEVQHPQRFTVSRTLPKTHLAGSPLQVHRPLIAAY